VNAAVRASHPRSNPISFIAICPGRDTGENRIEGPSCTQEDVSPETAFRRNSSSLRRLPRLNDVDLFRPNYRHRRRAGEPGHAMRALHSGAPHTGIGQLQRAVNAFNGQP